MGMINQNGADIQSSKLFFPFVLGNPQMGKQITSDTDWRSGLCPYDALMKSDGCSVQMQVQSWKLQRAD